MASSAAKYNLLANTVFDIKIATKFHLARCLFTSMNCLMHLNTIYVASKLKHFIIRS